MTGYYDTMHNVSGMNPPKPSIGNVPEYQVSAWPWLTSSAIPANGVVEIDFPYVTSYIIIKNTTTGTTSIRFGFTPNGTLGSNYIPLGPADSFTADVKCKALWISGSFAETYTLFAGLTGIETRELVFLTASNGYTGVG